jgi:low affinity Fe/Cu permease
MVERCSSRIRERCEKESVSDLESSVWRTAYVAAILETDAARMTVRISEARAAINERLNSHVGITPHEREALDAAVQRLATMKVQYVELIEPTAPTGGTVPPG